MATIDALGIPHVAQDRTVGRPAVLLLGTSGFLLNHRSIMKIDTGEVRPASAMGIAIPAGASANAAALGEWARTEFGLRSDAAALVAVTKLNLSGPRRRSGSPQVSTPCVRRYSS